MDATIRVEDQTHENFWRQLLRWLVDGVPDAVETRPLTDRVEPGQPVALTADVVDPRFVELNDASVVAHVTSPSGKTVDVPMQWTGERNGQYRASFDTSEAGWYQAKLDATRAGQAGRLRRRARPRGAGRRRVLRRGDARAAAEADRAGHRRPLLHRPTRSTTLPDDLKYSGRGVTAVEERELWHMPILLMALVGDHLRRVGPAADLEARVSAVALRGYAGSRLG